MRSECVNCGKKRGQGWGVKLHDTLTLARLAWEAAPYGAMCFGCASGVAGTRNAALGAGATYEATWAINKPEVTA